MGDTKTASSKRPGVKKLQRHLRGTNGDGICDTCPFAFQEDALGFLDTKQLAHSYAYSYIAPLAKVLDLEGEGSNPSEGSTVFPSFPRGFCILCGRTWPSTSFHNPELVADDPWGPKRRNKRTSKYKPVKGKGLLPLNCTTISCVLNTQRSTLPTSSPEKCLNSSLGSFHQYFCQHAMEIYRTPNSNTYIPSLGKNFSPRRSSRYIYIHIFYSIFTVCMVLYYIYGDLRLHITPSCFWLRILASACATTLQGFAHGAALGGRAILGSPVS